MFIRSIMKATPFGGQAVFRPLLLHMDKRALPFAKQQVLKRGYR
jgi:hypothetical protein